MPSATGGATTPGPGTPDPNPNEGHTAANRPDPAIGPSDRDQGSSTVASGIGRVEPAAALVESAGLPDLAGGSTGWILVASGVAATGGMALFAALVLLLPLRRSRIVAPVGQASAPAVVTSVENRLQNEAVLDPEPPPEEAYVPRWLRPSLRNARHRSAHRAPIERVPLRFGGPVNPAVERRSVRYRFVKLATQPDEILGDEVARLDRGDEVEILGEEHGFVRVRTPDGLDGWVPRMTLGPIGSEGSDPD